MTDHLTEMEFQQYAFEKETCEIRIVDHIGFCSSCKSKVKTYQEIFNAVKQLEKPAFDYDLSNLVLARIATPKPKFHSANYIIPFAVICLLGVILFISLPFLTNLFKGMGTFILYTIIISGLIITGYQAFEMYKNFQSKINKLNFY